MRENSSSRYKRLWETSILEYRLASSAEVLDNVLVAWVLENGPTFETSASRGTYDNTHCENVRVIIYHDKAHTSNGHSLTCCVLLQCRVFR